MAPPKSTSKAAHDDGKAETANHAKEKNGHGSNNHSTNGKLRRVASSTGTNSKDAASANAAPAATGAAPEPIVPTLQWSSFDRDVLHAYRREHHLKTPTSYATSYHQIVLSQPGSIGLHSPTMARRKEHRRQTKEQLAKAIRKHFNGLGVQENDVVVELIHKIRNEAPPRSGLQRQDTTG